MKIKEYIEHQNITASQFAERVGISNGALSLYISEKRFPRHPVARRMIDISNGAIKWDDIYPKAATA